MRREDEQYFERLEAELDEALAVANEARERGGDPTTEVEIPVAQDMADRVENILGIDGVAARVRELDGEMSREEAALALVADFVEGTVGDYESRAGKIEGAVRTAVALLTEGVVAAPIEGIDRVELLENDDGTEFVNVYYAGPIRSAGGTAQALSVLVADYARTLLGIDEFKPREDEVGRYAQELELYDDEVGLQYAPKETEAEFIARNMPIMLDGEATGDGEVSGYRDLERVDTNEARGGMCLVLGEGIALKAPKIQRYTRDLEEVDWPWLQDLIDGTYKTSGDSEQSGDEQEEIDDEAGDSEARNDEAGDGEAGDEQRTEDDEPAGPPRPEPSEKFLADLIAGRPVFSHPSEPGGFRLRYGRARNHGHATAGVHPATMHLVDDFLATGTQIKTERPGKAAGVVPVDTIEGPTVRLANGEVRRIDDPEEALAVRNGVERVLDLGEYLVNYGEFVENNHPLAPASYAVEWWRQEFADAGGPVQAIEDSTDRHLSDPTPAEAIEWATEYDAPLHPAYTYLWHDLRVDTVEKLAAAIERGEVVATDGAADPASDEHRRDQRRDSSQQAGGPAGDDRLVVPHSEPVREALETLLVEHTQTDEHLLVPEWRPLAHTLGFDTNLDRSWSLDALGERARSYDGGENAIRAINEIAPFTVRERAPTRVGNRMGRPEKSEERELSPAVHTLFPLGETGGNQRSVEDAAAHGDTVEGTDGQIEVEVGRRACVACGTETYRARCPDCGDVARAVYVCPDCDREVDPDESGRAECDRCETLADPTEYTTVNLKQELAAAKQTVGERAAAYDVLKGVKGLLSKEKVPEPIEKGILRAKHDVSAFKDGTVRYDMTDLPVTAVRPAELDVTAADFRELGYETDIRGDPLRHDDQVVSLRVQDIVLSEGAAEHMLRTADFVDDLLTEYYGLDPYYELEERDDLLGELVFGMAPHTSAAVVGRVVGFTSAAVGYAHPYFHAAKRRNCFHPETKIWYQDDSDCWHHDKIEAVVESHLSNPVTDEWGTITQELDTDVYVPSVDEDGNQTIQPVEAVSKHPAPEHLVRIECRSGRSMTVTPDHKLVRHGDGPERISAAEIETGDRLLSPKQIEYEGTGVEIDLLKELLQSESVPNEDLMIRGIGSEELKSLFREQTPGDNYVDPTANALSVSSSTVYNWVSRDSVPVDKLVTLTGKTDVAERIPDDVLLAVRRDGAEMQRHLSLDRSFAALLGYYAAEGFVRRESGSYYQTTICIPDEHIRDTLTETFETKLGVSAYEENEWKLTVSSRLVAVLFEDILAAGPQAKDKRIPDCVFGAPTDVLRCFLSAYFAGDGSAASERLEVRAHTVSDELRTDLQSALKRFGIATKSYQETRTPQTGAVAEFYDNADVPTFDTWVIKITSENAVQFAEQIGFDLPRKQQQLESVLDSIETRSQRLFGDGGDVWLDEVDSVEYLQSEDEYTYCLTVESTHTLVANDLVSGQCDGDEDCVMLLLDGLLNFSKTFLPDQRGGSVAEDSRLVAVDPDGDVRFLTFGELWDELDAPVEADGKFRKRACAFEGWQTYAFGDDHKGSLQPIEKAIRYRADEQLLRVSTQFGRELTITDSHSLFRYDDGIEEVAGSDLHEGDLVVAPRNLDIETEQTTVDVVSCVETPYVVIDDHVEDLLRTAWETTGPGSPTRQAFHSGLEYRLERHKIPYDRFAEILRTAGFAVPQDVQIGLMGSSDGIARTIEVDEEFAWLLGLFVAEGTTSSVCPSIHNADEDLINRAAEIIESKLDHEPGRRWSNRAYELRFPAVFREVLYAMGFEDADSYDSSEKVVPDCIRRAPRPVVCSFISGFLAGDGSHTSDDNVTTLGFHTTSDDVKDGIVFLLHRLGLVASISEKTDRDGNRQDIYAVTVSGGATDNPLQRILDGGEPYHSKSLVVPIPDALMAIREMDIEGITQLIPKYLKRRENISLEQLRQIVAELDDRGLPDAASEPLARLRTIVDGDIAFLRVTDIERVAYDGHLYDLQVGGEPVFTANWLYAHNSMDAPLVMSSRIDPTEIDDEAHNVDIMDEYPREFYEATRECADPATVEDLMTIAEETLGTEREYAGFAHTHDTSDIAAGPELSAYKTLDSMEDKMDAQLALSRTLQAVEESDVAERIIEYHFLPDLLGNLKAFSSQEFRCLGCGTKYRRAPLSGECRQCGGDVNLTVHEGSVNKYIDTAIRVAEEFGAREYTKQRLEILDTRINRIFEDDTNKQSGIADFM